MWSIGCIFAELLQMEKSNCRKPNKRGPIFPGDSSYPLSPDNDSTISSYDQMNVIFDIIGTPSHEEIEKINDNKARKYLRSFKSKLPRDLKIRYPGAHKDALDLLSKLLKFDVEQRINVDDAIKHPFLSNVRDPDVEKMHDLVSFQFEDANLSKQNLRTLILQEVLELNPEFEEIFEKSGAMDF